MSDLMLPLYTAGIFFLGLWTFGLGIINFVILPIMAAFYVLLCVPWPFYAAALVGLVAVAILHK